MPSLRPALQRLSRPAGSCRPNLGHSHTLVRCQNAVVRTSASADCAHLAFRFRMTPRVAVNQKMMPQSVPPIAP